MARTLIFLALAVSFLAAGPVRADEARSIEARHVEEALVAAGENRAALERVLAHFPASQDAQKCVAARFLIANMPGKGYVVTQLRTKDGKAMAFDPLSFVDFKAALAALEGIEKEHGELDFARDRRIEDVKTITAEFLIRHVDEAFAAWRGTPEGTRVGFDAFLDYVLPYRGSQEPLDDWMVMLRRRYASRARALGAGKISREELYKWLAKDVGQRVRFDERYYLHPTDQGFTQMGRSGQGRCEDITNMQTYAARSLALATAADYTPAWAHRDNNHAWNVLLDAEGKGFARSNAHAAKVYRKTYAIQRGNLTFQLPEGREAPDRFLKSTAYIDVTDQYAPTTDVPVRLDPAQAGDEGFAYLCVFNGGKWVSIHWGRVKGHRVTFDRMGRNIVYLPAVHDGEKLVPAADPLLVHKDGSIETLRGAAEGGDLLAVAVSPSKKSPDTHVVTPVSRLKEGTSYELKFWNGAWETVLGLTAGKEPMRFERLPKDGLYWLVANDSRRLERIFTIERGRQRWW